MNIYSKSELEGSGSYNLALIDCEHHCPADTNRAVIWPGHLAPLYVRKLCDQRPAAWIAIVPIGLHNVWPQLPWSEITPGDHLDRYEVGDHLIFVGATS